MGKAPVKPKYPKSIDELKEFLVENGWEQVEDEERWMLSYDDTYCVRFDPEAGHAVDIEFMNSHGNEFFVFTSVKSFLEFCKDRHTLKEDDEKGVYLYMDGIGEIEVESLQDALDHLNSRITITVNGKQRKLK